MQKKLHVIILMTRVARQLSNPLSHLNEEEQRILQDFSTATDLRAPNHTPPNKKNSTFLSMNMSNNPAMEAPH